MKTENQIFEIIDQLQSKDTRSKIEEAILNALDWVLDRSESPLQE